MKCEWPTREPCQQPVVAKVGLPYKSAIWVCKQHFDQWEAKRR